MNTRHFLVVTAALTVSIGTTQAKLPEIDSVVMNEPVFDEMNVRSFEFAKDCVDFRLSEDDAREYLTKARAISRDDSRVPGWQGKRSRCVASGVVKFATGSRASFSIDKTRYAKLKYESGPIKGRILYFHCDACESRQFFPNDYDLEKGFRPVIERLTIADNSDMSASCRKAFTLNESEIRYFFSSSYAGTREEGIDPNSCILGGCDCITHGEATLKGGQRAKWTINREWAGLIETPDGSITFHCMSCPLERTLSYEKEHSSQLPEAR